MNAPNPQKPSTAPASEAQAGAAKPDNPGAAAKPGNPGAAAKPGNPGAAAKPDNPGAAAKPGNPGKSTDLAVRPKPAPPAKPAPVQLQMGPPAGSRKPDAAIPVREPARAGRVKPRHVIVLISFILAVLIPSAITGWYLWNRAADQYVSTVAFSVRTEENASAISSFLGPLNLSGSSTSDTDILNEFIQSQDLVARVDKKHDLRSIWSKADPKIDPIFAYDPPGTIEDLVDHWGRKVKINYDSGTGLIELKVLAFDPDDAKTIAEEIYLQSTTMINQLSAIAREDAIGYARDELAQAVERLKIAREALTRFRNRTQIVDPTIDLQGRAGLLNTLNQQLAAALIELDLLNETTRANDPRIAQSELKIQVIEKRIDEEKRKLGLGGSESDTIAFATLLGEYERLVVDREFAEQTYTASLASYDVAQAEARRQSRYLAAHIRPTLAEKPEYPQRLTLLGLISLFLFLIWSVLVLVAYSLRDRR